MIIAKMADVRSCCLAARCWHEDKGDELKLEAWHTWLDHTFPKTADRNCAWGFINTLCEHSDLPGEAIFNLCRLFVKDIEEVD